MEKKEKEVYIPNVGSLFSSQRTRDEERSELVKKISIKDIDNFPNHPFKVKVSEEDEIVQSIKDVGVTTPILVRPKENGRYELISGHRRKMASELLGIDTIPCIIRELSDDEATIMMVDSNYQRERILPSEKAFAYKLKMDALNNKGKRTDLTLSQVDTRLDNAKDIGKEFNDSRAKVFRYIRLTELIPEFLTMVDNDALKLSPSMAISPAHEISFLTKDEQKTLLDFMQCYDCTPSHAQAIDLKNHSLNGTLTTDYMEEVMSEEKPNQIPRIGISVARLVLPSNLKNDQEREDYIVEAVRFYARYQQKKREKEQER
ncbi:MAG: ParB/RepB/Spo0J family partition protein [Bacilli bacterium]|nr:ParB/RepB/Spo0J family partition protein [Bacilli bacterium]